MSIRRAIFSGIWARLSCLLACLVAAGGCASRAPAPQTAPAPLVESAAFKTLASNVYGILEADLDGDGAKDAVVVQAHEAGFRLLVLRSEWQGEEQGWGWRRVCRGGYVAGEDLDAFRWVNGANDAHWIFVRALSTDPDESVQSFAVFDVAACKGVHSGRVRVARPAGLALAPADFSGGIQALEHGLVTVDQPQYLRLAGQEGEVFVLHKVRWSARSWEQLEGPVEHGPGWLSVLAPMELQVEHLHGDDEAVAMPMLLDDDESTALALREGEHAQLRLRAPSGLVLLELHHGCYGEARDALHLVRNGFEQPYDSQEALANGSGFVARGVSHPGEQGELRALVVPEGRPKDLVLQMDGPACLREVKGYGFAERSR